MSISTYAELQSAILSWLNRADSEATARAPEWIALAEADINAQLGVRTIESDQTLTASVGSRFVNLPASFREAQNLWIEWDDGRGDPLRFVTPELLVPSSVNGCPTAWCIDGTRIAFDCPADTAYTLTLRQIGGLALSDSATTNLILTNYPNVYLFGALKEAEAFYRDLEAVQLWESKYQDALKKAKAKEGRTKSLVTLSTEPGALTSYGQGRSFNINRGW